MGNLKLAMFLAYKSIIKGNRWALVLIVAVMALSFANLILTPSILNGVTATLDRQQVDTLFGDVVIDPAEDEYYLDHTEQILARVRQVPGVLAAAAHLNSRAHIEYRWQEKALPEDNGRSGTWNIIGIDPVQETGVTTVHQHMIAGRYLVEADRDAIILGIEITGNEGAESPPFLTLGGVNLGDSVRVIYPNGVRREYVVKGIFQAREITETDRLAFVTRKEMASVMGRTVYSGRASQLLVTIAPGENEADLIRKLQALDLGGQVRSWRDYGGAIGGIVTSFDIVASLVNSIMLIVAGIVMFIVIYINVLGKKRQIGILRAIGIKRKVVVYSYLVQAVFYAAAGIGLGWLLMHFAIEPYFISHPLDLALGPVSLSVQPLTIHKAVIGLFAAAGCAGFIPVLGIIRQSIIKAIWGN